MRYMTVVALVLAILTTGCNMDWLTGVPGEKPEPCQPEVLRPVPVTADSALADTTGVPIVLVGVCVVKQ